MKIIKILIVLHEHDALKTLLPITIYENEAVISALHQAGFKKCDLGAIIMGIG